MKRYSLMLAVLLLGPLAHATDAVPTSNVPMTHVTAPVTEAKPIVVPPAPAAAPAPAPATRPTDHKYRAVGECQLLSSYEQTPCLQCIGRFGSPHHLYRPDYPAGDRCRLDNGMP
jgi:hypothetical protein